MLKGEKLDSSLIIYQVSFKKKVEPSPLTAKRQICFRMFTILKKYPIFNTCTGINIRKSGSPFEMQTQEQIQECSCIVEAECFSCIVVSALGRLQDDRSKQGFLNDLISVLAQKPEQPALWSIRLIGEFVRDGSVLEMAGELEKIIQSSFSVEPLRKALSRAASKIQMDNLKFVDVADTPPQFSAQDTPQGFMDMLSTEAAKDPRVLEDVFLHIGIVGISPLDTMNISADLMHLHEYIEHFGNTNEENRFVLETIAVSLQAILESDEKEA